MTKQEFINELRSHLAGRVDDRELQTQISYYDSYITQEINSGKTIDEVMNQLGSPRLIAKTILQAYMAKNDPISRQFNKENAGYEERYADDDIENESEFESIKFKIWKIVTMILVLFTVIVIVGVIFKVVIYLIPVFIFIMALYLLIKILTS